jgi:hypothetical protein
MFDGLILREERMCDEVMPASFLQNSSQFFYLPPRLVLVICKLRQHETRLLISGE